MPVFHLEVLPSQEKAHALTSKFRGFSGPVGCIAGETVIEDLATGQSLTVAELQERGIAPVVQTLLGPVQASVPFIKGIAALWEFKLETGESVRVTANHLFFSNGIWRRACSLTRFDSILTWDLEAKKTRYSFISSVRLIRTDLFYDLHVPIAESYIAHGILHHNSGKSLWLCDALLIHTYRNPGRTFLLGAPTYPMLRDATLKTMFSRLDHHGIRHKYLKSENTITINETGSVILCRAVENFERLRGTNLAGFALDETSYCPELAWLQLEARMRDPLAAERTGFGAWTPKGFDWVYRRFIKNPLRGYAAVLANPRENTYLPADFYDGLLRSYSPNFARQEVLGEYLNVFSGRAYSSFSSETGGNIYTTGAATNYKGFAPVEYTAKRPILWALDFNINPATSVICQSIETSADLALRQESRIGGRTKQLNVLDEIFLNDSNTYQHCEEFYDRVRKKLVPGHKIHVIVYGDASGERRQSSSSKSDYQIIQDFFSRHPLEFTYERRVPSANPPVKDRVNSVNALCFNAVGIRRLAIAKRCKELIHDMEEVAWAMDPNGNMLAILSTKDKMRTHISDALGYLIYEEFGIRSSVGHKAVHIH